MKKLFLLFITVIMILCLAACVKDKKPSDIDIVPSGSAQQQPQKTEKISEEPKPTEKVDTLSETKTMAWFMKYAEGGSYTLEMQGESEGSTIKTLTACDDGRIYTKSTVDEMTSVSIIMDNAMYILDPQTKTYMKMDQNMSDVQEFIAKEAAAYETAISTGNTDVNGKSYFYEEFAVEGESVKYCFDGDNLKYMVADIDGSAYIMEILHIEKGADKSLFEIPSDYNLAEY